MALVQAIYQVMDNMYNDPERWSDAAWIQNFEYALAQSVQQEDPEEYRSGFMHMVGQSHIDVAWLWPVRETVRKSSRTFSTIFTLMDVSGFPLFPEPAAVL